jgi:nucleolar protein 56
MEQREFLRKQMLKKTREQIEEKFAGKEIHIIKAVNLLSDLESINNLMSENVSEWKVRQPAGNAKNAYTELEKNVQNIGEEREKLIEFIQKEMSEEFPNFSVIATPIIGAKLLASAGSKKRLCFAPSSTIQMLGAEKALFNHIKHKAKCPKHGHLFNHPLLQKLSKQKRGKAARVLAGKLSIALKQDYFNGENNTKEVLSKVEKTIEKISQEPEKIRKPPVFLEQKSQNNQSQHKTFTPEERKAFFEKQNKEKGNFINQNRTIQKTNNNNVQFTSRPKQNFPRTNDDETSNNSRDKFKKFNKFKKFKKKY